MHGYTDDMHRINIGIPLKPIVVIIPILSSLEALQIVDVTICDVASHSNWNEKVVASTTL